MFKTKKEGQNAIIHFNSLLEHPGWKLIVEILDRNIESVNQQIKKGYRSMSKEELDASLGKLVTYEEMKNTPQTMIERITTGKTKEPNFDPFDTLDDVKKRRA